MNPSRTSTLIKFAQTERKTDFKAVEETAEGEEKEAEEESELLYPELNEAVDAIAGNGRSFNPQKLGKWIGKNKARLVDNYRIIEAEQNTKSRKSKEWRVVPPF